jgi:hypothetical protein
MRFAEPGPFRLDFLLFDFDEWRWDRFDFRFFELLFFRR